MHLLLPYLDLEYGVLLPSQPNTPHVLKNGQVVPRVISPTVYTRSQLRRQVQLVIEKWKVPIPVPVPVLVSTQRYGELMEVITGAQKF